MHHNISPCGYKSCWQITSHAHRTEPPDLEKWHHSDENDDDASAGCSFAEAVCMLHAFKIFVSCMVLSIAVCMLDVPMLHLPNGYLIGVCMLDAPTTCHMMIHPLTIRHIRYDIVSQYATYSILIRCYGCRLRLRRQHRIPPSQTWRSGLQRGLTKSRSSRTLSSSSRLSGKYI